MEKKNETGDERESLCVYARKYTVAVSETVIKRFRLHVCVGWLLLLLQLKCSSTVEALI